MYVVGTYKNSRRQEQRVPFVGRDLRRAIQVNEVGRRKCNWRCSSTMPAVGDRYTTEKTREIWNTPFCILRATQIPFASRLVALLAQGHGLLERFLITFLKCLRPTSTQTS